MPAIQEWHQEETWEDLNETYNGYDPEYDLWSADLGADEELQGEGDIDSFTEYYDDDGYLYGVDDDELYEEWDENPETAYTQDQFRGAVPAVVSDESYDEEEEQMFNLYAACPAVEWTKDTWEEAEWGQGNDQWVEGGCGGYASDPSQWNERGYGGYAYEPTKA
jgi:hypothetical protein